MPEQGTVTVTGTVPTQEQLSKIDPLAKEIKGVKSVTNKVTVAQQKRNKTRESFQMRFWDKSRFKNLQPNQINYSLSLVVAGYSY